MVFAARAKRILPTPCEAPVLKLSSAFVSLFAVSVLLYVAGCGAGSSAEPGAPEVVSGGIIGGKVFGGQQPVVGAHVYLMAAGTSGYGAAATSLLNTDTTDSIGSYVATDINGSFSLGGKYSCTAGTQVYAYSLGGDAGLGTNSMIGLMAVLGNCPASGTLASQVPNLIVNETSTIAAAYALAGYAVDATHISSFGSTAAQSGIANAAANAFQLNDITKANGARLTTASGGGTAPQQLVNALANILAACINSSGSNSMACTAIQTNTMNGTTPPADTATAAINIAHHPSVNVSALFPLSTATAPFQPALSSQPTDFSMMLTYPSKNIRSTNALAIDQSGNVWVTSAYYEGITETSPLGVYIKLVTDPGYMVTPTGLAILPGGVITTVDQSFKYILFYDPSASSFSVVGIAGTTTTLEPFISVTRFGFYGTGGITAGQPTLFYDYSGHFTNANSAAQSPYATASDNNDWIWITSNKSGMTSGAMLEKFKYDGTPAGTIVASACTGTNYARGTGIALDSANNVWASDNYTSRLVEFANSCSYMTDYPTISAPTGLAVDGNNTLWTVNASNKLGATTNAGVAVSPAAGYSLGVTGTLIGPAVDGSGNIWFVNTTKNTLQEVVGIAAPVVTPLAVAVQTNKVGQLPQGL